MLLTRVSALLQLYSDVFSADDSMFRLNGVTNEETPHLIEMRGTSKTADQSGTNLRRSHVVKRLRNAFEVKAHSAQGMPKMALKEKECKIEVRIG